MIKRITRLFLLLLLLPFSLHAADREKAVFAGGCFWCMESDFEHYQAEHPGIISVISGYDGGHVKRPDYELVSSGTTDYKEVVQVVYDANKISYSDLVKFFFRHVDPTVRNKQFCDKGKQYASAIYYMNNQQKSEALKVKKEVSTVLKVPVYTEILPSTHFYPAEAYHQDFYKNHAWKYKFYRWRCGRDKRVEEVWGDKRLK